MRRACADGDLDGFRAVLADDVTAYFDGGGRVRAPIVPVTSSEHVARSMLTLLRAQPRTTVATWPVNARAGLVLRQRGRSAR